MIAYLILAHKNPAQLARLVDRLRSPNAHFFIHLEKKVDSAPFLQAVTGENIHWVERRSGEWGFLGIVRATLTGMKDILDHRSGFERIILLSGQDYPLRSASEIENFFAKSPETNFIFYYPLPSMKDLPAENGGMDRIEKHHFKFLKKRRVYPSGCLSDYLFGLFFKLPRRFPEGMKPYCGCQWWSLTRDAAKYTLDFVQKNPAYVRFYETCYIPDESFFQTILLNSPLKDKCVPDDLRYSDWTKPNVSLPAVLKMEDLEALKQASKKALFARKFDTAIDSEILDRLDSFFSEPF